MSAIEWSVSQGAKETSRTGCELSTEKAEEDPCFIAGAEGKLCMTESLNEEAK